MQEEAVWQKTTIVAGPATNRFRGNQSMNREAAGRRRSPKCREAKKAFAPNGKSSWIAGTPSIPGPRRKRHSTYTRRVKRPKPRIKRLRLKSQRRRKPLQNVPQLRSKRLGNGLRHAGRRLLERLGLGVRSEMGRLVGLEPTTSRITIWRYYRLSYSRRTRSRLTSKSG